MKPLINYTTDELNKLKGQSLYFFIGSKNIEDNTVTDVLKGKIGTIYLAANDPDLPVGFSIVCENDKRIRKIDIFQVKEVSETLDNHGSKLGLQ